jgi:hypothetical protein
MIWRDSDHRSGSSTVSCVPCCGRDREMAERQIMRAMVGPLKS